MDSLATLSAFPASEARFFPRSGMDLRSSVVVQMGDTRVPVAGAPGGSFPTRDGQGSLRVSLTVSDRRYPTFIPANIPFPRPRGVQAPKVGIDVDHYDEEYESAAGRELESSGSTSTVKPARVREESVRVHFRDSKGDGQDQSRHHRVRHGRNGEVNAGRQSGYGAPRTFLASGVDSEDEGAPLRYSGALAV